jgi:hypothetical protein
MPSVLPRSSQLLAADFTHSPRCAASDFGKIPRISMIISPRTSSATLRVLEKGALKTGMPRWAAGASSTWSVPMQKQPMAISRSAASSTRRVTRVRERMPRRCTPPIRRRSSSSARAPGSRVTFA